MTKSFVPLRDVTISPPITVDGGHLISIRGPFNMVLRYTDQRCFKPGDIIAFGQNGALYHDMDDKMSMEAHMIVMVADEPDISRSIDKQIVKALKQKDFDYAHMLGAMKNNVQVAIFGSDFARNLFASHIIAALFSIFFEKGKLKHVRKAHTLLFIGDDEERVIGAQIALRRDSFRVLPCPLLGKAATRHAQVGNDILLCASYEGKTIHGVTADDLVDVLTQEDTMVVWSEASIGQATIEDITVIDGVEHTIVLTLKDSDYRLLPMVARFRRERLELLPSAADGVKLEDLGGEILSPPVRITQGGEVILADRNGSSTLVRFEHMTSFGSAFEHMVMRALSGSIASSHRTASGIY